MPEGYRLSRFRFDMQMPLSVNDWIFMTAWPAASSPQLYVFIITTFQRLDESNLCRRPKLTAGFLNWYINGAPDLLLAFLTHHQHGIDRVLGFRNPSKRRM